MLINFTYNWFNLFSDLLSQSCFFNKKFREHVPFQHSWDFFTRDPHQINIRFLGLVISLILKKILLNWMAPTFGILVPSSKMNSKWSAVFPVNTSNSFTQQGSSLSELPCVCIPVIITSFPVVVLSKKSTWIHCWTDGYWSAVDQ